MKFLSIDTSTKNFSLAVSDGNKIVRSRNVKLKGVLSSVIIPAIRGVLYKAGIRLDQLDGFAVGLGPGSFTSLRVGLSTIKALGFVTQKPIIGIASLDILATNVMDNGVPNICVICDAKRGLAYMCLYKNQKSGIKRAGKYLLTDPDEVLKQIKEPTIFVGDGIKIFRDKIINKLHKKAVFSKEKQSFPQAKNLVPLAVKRFINGKFDNINTLVPLYLYPQDCQVRRG